jgi:hypothetical protein
MTGYAQVSCGNFLCSFKGRLRHATGQGLAPARRRRARTGRGDPTGIEWRASAIPFPGGVQMGPYDDGHRESPAIRVSDADTPDLPGPLETAAPWDTRPKSASYIVNRLLALGASLASAGRMAGNGPASDRIAAVTDEVFQLIHDIEATPSGLATDQAAEAKYRLARAARELQARALETVAHLEQRADLARRPSRTDYPAEIKRWRAFAAQAEQMAERWEQRP